MDRVCFCGNQYLNQCISRLATRLFPDTQQEVRTQKPQQNRREGKYLYKYLYKYFPTSFCWDPADRSLAVLCVCRGLLGNRLVPSLVYFWIYNLHLKKCLSSNFLNAVSFMRDFTVFYSTIILGIATPQLGGGGG